MATSRGEKCKQQVGKARSWLVSHFYLTNQRLGNSCATNCTSHFSGTKGKIFLFFFFFFSFCIIIIIHYEVNIFFRNRTIPLQVIGLNEVCYRMLDAYFAGECNLGAALKIVVIKLAFGYRLKCDYWMVFFFCLICISSKNFCIWTPHVLPLLVTFFMLVCAFVRACACACVRARSCTCVCMLG